jgi:hypothetical protein
MLFNESCDNNMILLKLYFYFFPFPLEILCHPGWEPLVKGFEYWSSITSNAYLFQIKDEIILLLYIVLLY